MKFFNKILIMLTFSFNQILFSQYPLELKVELDKTTYIQHEEITAIFKLINKTTSFVESYLPTPAYYSTDFELKNNSGQRFGYHGAKADLYGEPRKIKIRPKGKYQFPIVVTAAFSTKHFYPHVTTRDYLEPDTYYFRAIQRIDKTHTVESEWVSFEVTPVPPEEISAVELLSKINDAYIASNFDLMANIGEEFLQIFPNSIYKPLVLHAMMWANSELGKKENVVNYLKRVIIEYPASGFAERSLPLLLSRMETQEERIQFLESIKTNEKTWLQESISKGLKDLKAGKTNIDWED